MKQEDRRKYLINYLLQEEREYANTRIPNTKEEQKRLLRALMNLRMPGTIEDDFLKVQDEYLSEVRKEKGIVSIEDLKERKQDLFLWRGDITRLSVGAIVNAANSGMTGCYQPCHGCIDNCIHTYAGIQLRTECGEMMQKQGHEEKTGSAKITSAYNLPCEYVIHTVGPIVQGALTEHHREQLRSCYEACMRIADEHEAKSIAFCCISTGVFMFPNEEAAKVAVDTVLAYKKRTNSTLRVVFNVFKEEDERIYEQILSER